MLHEPFIKVFFPRDFDGLIVGDMAASIVDVHSRGIDHSWMQKKAAAGIFKDTDISPKDGYSHIHLIALGDADRYGQNRNGDIFYGSGRRVIIPYPEKSASRHIDVQCGNADRVCTFEKHAKVYRNHINKKDSPSYGDIVKAAHNKDMARGELIICVKDDDWSDDLQKLAAGKPIDFSMAARVPYDTCSYCGHKSRSRDEYCEHAKDNMTAITKEGHQVGVINDFHTFFDISRVPVRADRIAQGLLKAASTAEITSRDLLTSMYFSPPPVYDEIANDTFRMKKLAVLRKLAAIEKEIEARGDSIMGSSTAKSLVKSLMPDMSESDMAQFAAGNSESVPEKLAALADVKVILSLPDFMKIVTGPRNAQSVEKETDEAEDRLPGVFNRILSSSDLPDFSMTLYSMTPHWVLCLKRFRI